jgi:hypothetical protein
VTNPDDRSSARRDAAQSYIEAEFGQDPFVAAHVRPFPDSCAKTWAAAGDLRREKLLFPYCDNGGLVVDLAPALMDVMQRHKAKKLFVLSPPSIRHRINTLLSDVSRRRNGTCVFHFTSIELHLHFVSYHTSSCQVT